jgi:hypothetical protein
MSECALRFQEVDENWKNEGFSTGVRQYTPTSPEYFHHPEKSRRTRIASAPFFLHHSDLAASVNELAGRSDLLSGRSKGQFLLDLLIVTIALERVEEFFSGPH